MKKLYEFSWDFCWGNVEGIFISTEKEIKENLGKTVYFGEILGKHSEIYGDLSEEDLKVLTDDQEFIKKFKKYIGDSFGYNPLNYVDEPCEND